MARAHIAIGLVLLAAAMLAALLPGCSVPATHRDPTGATDLLGKAEFVQEFHDILDGMFDVLELFADDVRPVVHV